jgi:AraC family transcriptional regulator
MDFVDRIVGHDVWFTNRLLDRAGGLPAEALDRPTSQTWRWQSENGDGPALRELLNQLVGNKEIWWASMVGKPVPTEQGDSLEEMKRRYEVAGKEFLRLVRDVKQRGAWDEGFVDALCDPPETFTYGGMLAHVATFGAFRRTMAIFAFRGLEVDDLGLGDPVEWERSLQ